jgi:hypothetical protein
VRALRRPSTGSARRSLHSRGNSRGQTAHSSSSHTSDPQDLAVSGQSSRHGTAEGRHRSRAGTADGPGKRLQVVVAAEPSDSGDDTSSAAQVRCTAPMAALGIPLSAGPVTLTCCLPQCPQSPTGRTLRGVAVFRASGQCSFWSLDGADKQ